MADFVQVMKDWRRMCETIQSENQQKSSDGWCIGCPIQGNCVIDSEIKYTCDNVLAMIGERIQSWAAENPEPQYPTWTEWLSKQGFVELKDGGFVKRTENEYTYECKTVAVLTDKAAVPIPADIAERLGLQPKET